MNFKHSASAVALALVLAACGRQQNQAPAKDATVADGPARPAPGVYSGLGTIQSIAGDQVKIAHGPIAGIGWPAMTMTFTAPPGMASGAKVGSKVAFSFRQQGSAYVLTSVKPQ